MPLCLLLQLKDLKVFTVVRAIFQLTDEIPCISAVVVALLAEVHPEEFITSFVSLVMLSDWYFDLLMDD